MKQNDCVKVLLDSGADPNLRTISGATPLITAIASENQFAVRYLLDHKANPNIGNSNDEYPLSYAINKHNPEAVSLLLANGAVADHNSINYAIKMNDVECTRILIANCPEAGTTNPDSFDIAQNLEDPSIELLLFSVPPLETATGIDFVNKLNERLKSAIRAVNTKFGKIDDDSAIPKFLQEIQLTIHRLVLFSKLLKMKVESLTSEIEVMKSQPQGTFDNPEVDSVIRQIIEMWSKKLNDTNIVLDSLHQRILTPSGIETSEKWLKTIQKRKEFIETLLDHGIDESLSLRELEKRLEQAEKDLKRINQLIDYEIDKKDFYQATFDFISSIEPSNLDIPKEKQEEVTQIINKIKAEMPKIELEKVASTKVRSQRGDLLRKKPLSEAKGSSSRKLSGSSAPHHETQISSNRPRTRGSKK